MKKAVVFDFDGTLVDSLNFVGVALEKTITKLYSKKIEPEEIYPIYGRDERGILMALLKEDYSDNTFSTYLDYYRNLHNDYIPSFFEGIEDILKMLKENNIQIYLLTGRTKESTDISLTLLNGFKYFLDYYVGSPYKINKTDNLNKLCLDHKLNKEDIIYVGDSSNDIISCSEAGVDLISVEYARDKRLGSLKDKNPVCAETTSELKEILKKVCNLK